MGRMLIGASIGAMAIAVAQPALPQDASGTPAATPQDGLTADSDIVITGRRAAERAAIELKKASDAVSESSVADDVGKARGWSLPTVKTLLSRLVAKQAVSTEPDGRRFLYRPLLERSNYVEGESRRLVDRLFGGRAAPLLAHLAEAEALSDEDIAEIEALLKGLKQ